MRKTYWHNHPRGFANECDMVFATTREEREYLRDLGYERLSRAEARKEIRWVNGENESWESNRAFGPMALDTIEQVQIEQRG